MKTINNDSFKVRVWNVSGGYYLPEFYLTPAGEVCEFGVFNGTPQVRKFDNQENFRKERCTGLMDKNNKLIYEGDVVVGSWNTTLVVNWDVVSSSYRVKPLEDKCGDREIHYYTVITTLPDGSIKCIDFEIIGTIHDDQFRDAAKMIYGENE